MSEPQESRAARGFARWMVIPLTLATVALLHVESLLEGMGAGAIRWSAGDLERAYREGPASLLGKLANRGRVRLGLDANEVRSRKGELYYLPDLEHLAGKNFLSEARTDGHVVLQDEKVGRRSSNPLPAILDLDRQLRARGARLVIVPVPSKATLALPEQGVATNAGYKEFVASLEREGVPVYDPTGPLREYGALGNRVYLRSDSHWTPDAMRIAALFLARFLEERGLRPEGVRELFTGGTKEMESAGDLALLLEGASSERWQESVTIHPIRRAGGGPLYPIEESPVLLLGDSFTNVYSLPEMGWGSDAGFAEALSQSLGFTVDRLARNANGALTSRQALREEIGRLEGTKVVIWQFAARELSFGDWKVLELPGEHSREKESEIRGEIELEGTIVAAAPVPALTRTPYRQAVIEFHLAEVRADPTDALPSELVLLGMGVEDRRPTDIARWKAGQRIKVRVVPWGSVEERFGRLRRLALDDPELELIDAVRVWMVR